MNEAIPQALARLYREEGRRILATLIRLLGDFDAAEEGRQEAFAAAAAQWPAEGVPAQPAAWLVSVGRFKVLDRRRRAARLVAAPDLETLEACAAPVIEGVGPLRDDELRLVFVCCHPALAPEARIALTLREVAGLTTEEIARAYLVTPPTIAQRIVRAKAKIRDERLPYEIPGWRELPGRLSSVLRVIYLVFNEGYLATAGASMMRDDLCREALRLGRLLVDLLDDPEARGLLALMLLHEARRAARVDADGDLVLLEDQDRSRWDRALIDEGRAVLEHALDGSRIGPFLVQAAIAALHAEAPSVEATDWRQIVGLYDRLLTLDPSPVIALNRAAAIASRDGLAAGLAAMDVVMSAGTLDGYHLAHAARADLLRRLGRHDEARAAYRKALTLAQLPAERRFLARRLDELGDPTP